jgi:osmotically-inducible protein OsmY
VKTALLNDPDVGGLAIDVDTFKGVVTLSGRVKSPAEEQKAIQIARQMGGVADVKSALQVMP